MTTVRDRLLAAANPAKAALLARFFKTGVGQYGEGDKFLGIIVPVQRTLAKEFRDIELTEIQRLLAEPYHEMRLTALLILDYKYEKADADLQKKIFDFYIKNIRYINNWDLVDVTCRDIVGGYIFAHQQEMPRLRMMARSKNIWERRIGIVATAYFIARGQFQETLAISEILMRDEHDLIHKAVGWMLREVGKKDLDTLKSFLDKHAHEMPRTMLRYSLEKMKPPHKDRYMKAKSEHGRMPA
jgi:3-methyladenine DNA glycosylase AlkD